jgi:aldehyde:ferredoxin oxidoreductase
MNGWEGKILRVDLTSGACSARPMEPSVAKDYTGGRGLGSYLLNQEVDATCDALSAENPLIMATGPLTGTGCAIW